MIKDKTGRSLFVEIVLKFKYFYRKVLSSIGLIFVQIPKFTWSSIDIKDLDTESLVVQRMLKYELNNRSSRVVKLTSCRNLNGVRRVLMEMGFNIDMIWGASKYADMGAVINLDMPKRYGLILNYFQNFFIKFPIPKLHLFFLGFGKERLHIRVFVDDDNEGAFYITSHVDRTNPLSLSVRDKGEMIKSHLFDKIDGDYSSGEELLETFFEKKYLENKS